MTTYYGGDRCELLYSTSGTSLNDFISLGGWQGIPSTWVELSAELPEGAKYLAIRCVSGYQLMFCVDDVTYINADAKHIEMSVIGHNVYRDGVKLNDEPIIDNIFKDELDNYDEHIYHVTTVYDRGQSPASLGVTASKNTAVDGILDDNAQSAPIYYNLQGIRVADPKGIVLKKVNGKVEKILVK